MKEYLEFLSKVIAVFPKDTKFIRGHGRDFTLDEVKQYRQMLLATIEKVRAEMENPLLPKDLDMVFIVNAFHDLANPVELLNNLSLSLKQDAYVVILDRDPEKVDHSTDHFLSREEVLEKIEESVFELERLETFLPQHNIYIIRLTT